MKRLVFLIAGSVSFGLGMLGVFLPVLPTTPFMLLAAFLFARSSPRLDAWIKSTRVWKAYGAPFKESGCISKRKKAYILTVSYAVMGVSAALVHNPIAWGVLAAVAVFLAWLMLIRIPTVEEDKIAGPVAPDIELDALDEAISQRIEESARDDRRQAGS